MSTPRGLNSSHQLDSKELLFLLERAKFFQDNPHAASNTSVPTVAAFFENSTRTLFSFERALQRLNWPYSVFQSEKSSAQKGESMWDTLDTLYAQGFRLGIIRHSEPDFFRRYGDHSLKLVNAGSGAADHPTQGLLDVFTLWKRWGSLEGKNITFVGDIDHSRVARASSHFFNLLGATVTFCGPPHWVSRDWEGLGVQRVDDLDEALEEAHVVMALRNQTERHELSCSPSSAEFAALYGLKRKHFEGNDLLLMHPGPVRWGEEIEPELKNSEKSLINEQVENSVPVRIAVLEYCAGIELQASAGGVV